MSESKGSVTAPAKAAPAITPAAKPVATPETKPEVVTDSFAKPKPISLEQYQSKALSSYESMLRYHGHIESKVQALLNEFKSNGRVRYITSVFLYPTTEDELKACLESPDTFKKVENAPSV